MRTQWMVGVMTLGLVGMVGCRPSDILDVPPPSGEFTSSAVQGPTATLQAFYGAQAALFNVLGEGEFSEFNALDGWNGLLGDEFTWVDMSYSTYRTGYNVDARYTAASPVDYNAELGDGVLVDLLGARSSLVLAQEGLQQYAGTTYPATVGEAYALIGYAELFMAEDYCAGIPLSQAQALSGWSYGAPLSTDSLLQTAEAHFDSALAHAAGNDTVTALASIGKGRTLVDRDSLAQAATAVAQVPTAFVYNIQLEPISSDNSGSTNFYEGAMLPTYDECALINVGNSEGGNGINYVSADDPRLVVDSALAETCDGYYEHYGDSVAYYPLKFGNPNTGLIPLATGVEARLIAAEAALEASASDPTWLNDLNTLRNSGCPDNNQADCLYGSGQVAAQSSGLFSLTDPGTDSGRVRLLFRERAFWLFGTGIRLGDMRRLIRQYASDGFSESNVYPVGSYGVAGSVVQSQFPTYGTDVDFTLPTEASGEVTANPSYINYKGCETPTTQA